MLSKITEPYFRHDKSRICQGDILRDVEFYVIRGEDITEVFFDYMIVMSQDCDLEQGLKSQQEGSELNNQFLQIHIASSSVPCRATERGRAS